MFLKSVTALFVICGVFVISAANSMSTDEQECPKFCTLNYEPLCATNGEIYKEFSNSCLLKANNCRLQRLALQKFTTTKSDWCNTELVDGFQQLLEKFDILDLDTPECLKPCPLIYRPVCASNGQYRTVISNACLMEGINCILRNKTKATFSILKHDVC